jgi:hypothetical protein
VAAHAGGDDKIAETLALEYLAGRLGAVNDTINCSTLAGVLFQT